VLTQKEAEDLAFFNSMQESRSLMTETVSDEDFGDFESVPAVSLKSNAPTRTENEDFDDFQGVTQSSMTTTQSAVLTSDELLGFAEALADTYHYGKYFFIDKIIIFTSNKFSVF
jgi:hypothetical protein